MADQKKIAADPGEVEALQRELHYYQSTGRTKRAGEVAEQLKLRGVAPAKAAPAKAAPAKAATSSSD